MRECRMKNNHLMLDIETASSRNDAVVLTVGVLRFDPYGDASGDYANHWVIPFSDNKGGHIDLDTIKWWMEQTDEARKAAWLDTRGVAPTSPTSEAPFWNIVEMLNTAEHIWANDPDFDCTVMRSFMERNSVQWRWYRKHRSLRTLKAMFDIPFIEPIGTAHNALDDCRYQAEQVRAVYQRRAAPTYLAALA